MPGHLSNSASLLADQHKALIYFSSSTPACYKNSLAMAFLHSNRAVTKAAPVPAADGRVANGPGSTSLALRGYRNHNVVGQLQGRDMEFWVTNRLPKSHPASIWPCEVICLGEKLKKNVQQEGYAARDGQRGSQVDRSQMPFKYSSLQGCWWALSMKHLAWATALTETVSYNAQEKMMIYQLVSYHQSFRILPTYRSLGLGICLCLALILSGAWHKYPDLS